MLAAFERVGHGVGHLDLTFAALAIERCDRGAEHGFDGGRWVGHCMRLPGSNSARAALSTGSRTVPRIAHPSNG